MFGIGTSELIVIAVVALLVVGPKKLPELAKSLGRGFAEMKKASEGVADGLKESFRADDIKQDVNEIKNSLLYGKSEAGEEDRPPPAKPSETETKPDPYEASKPIAKE